MADTCGKWAELSLLSAERCELKVAMLRLDVQGVGDCERVVTVYESDTRTTRAYEYQTALAADPGFASLCDAYSRMADRYKQKREMELALVGEYKQEWAAASKMRRLWEEYERIKG